jgi:hypothetical protein
MWQLYVPPNVVYVNFAPLMSVPRGKLSLVEYIVVVAVCCVTVQYGSDFWIFDRETKNGPQNLRMKKSNH